MLAKNHFPSNFFDPLSWHLTFVIVIAERALHIYILVCTSDFTHRKKRGSKAATGNPLRGLKFISRQQEQISICSIAAERLGNTYFSLIASIGEKDK